MNKKTTTNETLKRLKTDLSKELEKENSDATLVLQLSNQIASLDESRVRFTTDAAVVRRLGRELVGRQETALAELIKNAYDADATSVDIRFLLNDQELLGIEVTDNGNGMTRAELVDGFMRLASDNKVREPRSPRFGRRRAGRKGIGRFATERLGDALVLTTKASGSRKALRISINWGAFIQGTHLNEIETSVSEIEWDYPHGTHLEILAPRDKWEQRQIDRVFKSISALLQPFHALSAGIQADNEPGFSVTFYHHDFVKERDVTVADVDSEIFKHAFAYIEGKIDDDGEVTWSLSSKRYGMSPKWSNFLSDQQKKTILPTARNARITAYYYINSSVHYPSLVYGIIKPQLDDNGGIRLYRNGFRVLPYGEPEDDWLQLDELESRRIYRNVSLANRNFLGAVEIDDPEGRSFEETSSREGLIENAAFIELRDTFSAMLVSAAKTITSIRLKQSGGTSLRPTRTEDVLDEARIAADRQIALAIQEGSDRVGNENKDDTSPKIGVTTNDVQQRREDLTKIAAGLAEAQKLAQERAMQRALASLGLTVAEFAHEFKHQSQFIDLTIDQLKRLVPPGPIADRCNELADRVSRARDFSSYFGEMISRRDNGRRSAVQLYLMAREFAEGVKPMLANPYVEMIVDRPASYDIYATPMYRAEWSSILMNLLTNSLKAIRRKRIRGKILIRTGFVDETRVFLDFCDNGDGIPQENVGKIFDAFFSTTRAVPAGATDLQHELGSGLGLKIVSDIVESVNGEVFVSQPPPGFSTSIRIVVPAAEPEEYEYE